MMDISSWKEATSQKRLQKDEIFKIHPESPLPFDQQQRFQGLHYYPPDPDYRFECPLKEHEKKDILKIEDTKGNKRAFVRWGEFHFNIGDRECTLQAYKSSPEEDRLFVPFRDATSGKETYGAGRYLDLEAGRQLMGEGKWILDFNDAYNPWCAYSPDYACPFVPPENWLKVEVCAGEKAYMH
jgi:uncharacterized protein (DUF1684 family)